MEDPIRFQILFFNHDNYGINRKTELLRSMGDSFHQIALRPEKKVRVLSSYRNTRLSPEFVSHINKPELINLLATKIDRLAILLSSGDNDKEIFIHGLKTDVQKINRDFQIKKFYSNEDATNWLLEEKK